MFSLNDNVLKNDLDSTTIYIAVRKESRNFMLSNTAEAEVKKTILCSESGSGRGNEQNASEDITLLTPDTVGSAA